MQTQLNAKGDYISLTEVAKIAPGRPSTNCIWRWCRRGVLARSGDRVRLQHVRIGGMIFTTAGWLEEFGHALADADAKHFTAADASVPIVAAPVVARPILKRRSRRQRFVESGEERRRQEIDQAERDVEAAGL